MPSIEQHGDEWCLVGYGDADTCYPSEDEAKAAVEKLTASEDKAVVEARAELKKQLDSLQTALTEQEKAAAHYATVVAYSKQAEEALPRMFENIRQFSNPPNWLTAPTEGVEKALAERIWDGIQRRLGRKSDGDEATGFKVAGNHWLATWSNNFEDRDGEIFTAKAIDDYVARVDSGIVPPPELWVWHVPGTRVGQAAWVDRHEHFLMAMGTFDDTPQGKQARDYYLKSAGKKSLSHGFTYPADQFDGKHYHQFNTFEISLLPRGAEANLYTSLEGVKAMAKVINETKKVEVFAVFGEELGGRILAAEEAKGKALEGLVEFKDFVHPAEAPATADKAAELANKAFTELVPDLMEGSAEAVTAALEAVKAAKQALSDNVAMRKEIDAMRAEMRLRPRASQSAETEVQTSHLSETLRKSLDEQNTERDAFWNTVVTKTP